MDYIWCLHCEKVYPKKDWLETGRVSARSVRNPDIADMMSEHGECPNCKASGFMDGWDWLDIAKPNGYPLEPEIGKEYPMYPERGNSDGK